MGKIRRHRDEILSKFEKDIHENIVDDQDYIEIRDTVLIELMCDIRDNIHFIAGNIRDQANDKD